MGNKKKHAGHHFASYAIRARELAPKTLWGLDLSHFLLQSRNPRSRFCYKTLTKMCKHQTSKVYSSGSWKFNCIVQMEWACSNTSNQFNHHVSQFLFIYSTGHDRNTNQPTPTNFWRWMERNVLLFLVRGFLSVIQRPQTKIKRLQL